MRFRLVVDGEAHEVEVRDSPRGTVVVVDGATYRARVRPDGDTMDVRIGKASHRFALRGGAVELDGLAHAVMVDSLEEGREGGAARGGETLTVEVRPPMPGRVVRLPAREGAAVRRGQVLAVLEAMKMQNEIVAPVDGVVESVTVKEGESIGGDRIIASIRTGPAAA